MVTSNPGLKCKPGVSTTTARAAACLAAAMAERAAITIYQKPQATIPTSPPKHRVHDFGCLFHAFKCLIAQVSGDMQKSDRRT